MLNNIMKNEITGTVNTAVLSVNTGNDPYEIFRIASEAGERFVRSARLLPENEYLGWQINTDKGMDIHVLAFSVPGTLTTAEDFGWIFHNSASVKAMTQESPSCIWEDGRRVYRLRFTPPEYSEESCLDYRDRNDHCSRDILDALRDAGAMIRITACAGHGGYGMVFISLREEMTLRMRAMLSMAFPDITAVEIRDEDCVPDHTEQLPAAYLAEVMTELLGGLMLEYPEDTCTDEIDDDGIHYSDDETADDDASPDSPTAVDDTTPIEELDFSIRSYNCLMRAGIRTVGELCSLTEEDLSRIRNLGRKSTEEIKEKLAERGLTFSRPAAQGGSDTQDYSRMLEELIGLENVKEQVKRITALAKMRQDMASLGRDPAHVVLNMEFVGNPGTAKTTVARIIAGIFHTIGLLSYSDIVEVGRADLVAKYVGHTAEKVRSVFRRAKGKLLFIDEAYSLADGSAGQFGDEAIDTIVQEMENNREDTIVIFAGYPDKMEELFSRNPGLRSRVPFHINFADYTTDEMVQISELEAKRRGFSLGQDAMEKIASICTMAALSPEMGNGRFCRNLVENAVLGYALRVYGGDYGDYGDYGDGGNVSKDFVLLDEDFTAPEILHKAKRSTRIGFCA